MSVLEGLKMILNFEKLQIIEQSSTNSKMSKNVGRSITFTYILIRNYFNFQCPPESEYIKYDGVIGAESAYNLHWVTLEKDASQKQCIFYSRNVTPKH